jgi:hypothetical protein
VYPLRPPFRVVFLQYFGFFAVGLWADRSGIGALTAAETILTAGMIVCALFAFTADKRREKI